MRGFAVLPLILIIVVVLSIGIIGFTKIHSDSNPQPIHQASQSANLASSSASLTPSSTPTITPKPTTKPSTTTFVDCVGPDGKHSQQTKKACDDFNKVWATPTPSPTATPAPASTSNSSSSEGCSVGQVSVGISASNGPLVGAALISISVKSNGSCASSYSNQQILRQGSSSITFSGLLPATYNVTAGYHGNNFTDSFDMSSGGNVSKTVTVSN